MGDKPIIFSAAMVRALLDGRKTMTRRLAWTEGFQRHVSTNKRKGKFVRCGAKAHGASACTHPSDWQRVKPGDRLWVRETWRDGVMATMYRADGRAGALTEWRSPIHMKRKDSRLTLIVSATKIERVQEISEADAKAEGVREGPTPVFADSTYRWGFAHLWSKLHGADSWDANPEVIALTFTVHKQNIDTLPKAEAA